MELNDEIMVGKRVSVPFGRNKVMAGLIYAVGETPPEGYQAKYIIDVLDDKPIVEDQQISLWNWISSYYMTSLGLVYNAALPAALKMEGESKMMLHPEFDETNILLDPKEYLIVENLKTNKEVSISQAMSLLKIKNIHKYVKSMYHKGVILLKEDMNDSFKPKTVLYIRIHERSANRQKTECPCLMS